MKNILVLENYMDSLNVRALKEYKKQGVTKVISKTTGLSHVRLKTAENMGFEVNGLGDYSGASVAEFAVMQLLFLARRVKMASVSFGSTTVWPVGFELEGKTALVVGSRGSIGHRVLRACRGLGLDTLEFDTGFFPNDDRDRLRELLPEAHVIFLCVPSIGWVNGKTVDNTNFFGEEDFELMKKYPFIVNPCRGSLLDPQVVAWAVNNGKIRGYACDDLPEHKVYGSNDCFFTPHIAARTREAQNRREKFFWKKFNEVKREKKDKQEKRKINLG